MPIPGRSCLIFCLKNERRSKNDTMKILQLGKFYPIRGGVEKVMYDLMSGLSGRGVRCDMLCASHEGKSRTIKVNGNARLMVTNTWAKKAATMISPSMVGLLNDIADGYDIIHIHHPDPMACMALRISGYKGKVVLHWHSDILRQRVLLKMYNPLQRWLIERADVIVGTSPVYVKESPFLADVQEKITYLPIGVEPVGRDDAAAEEVRRRYPGKRIVFTLGRLVEYKGYESLIEAARELDDSYVVLIGGTGPLHDTLQQKIEELGLTERVKLLGYLRDDELPGYFGGCDMFCLSSVMKTEAFGIVQIEAMSCGKPVVATRIPHSGVSWVNEDGVSGLNAEPENAVSLAQCIRGVLEDEVAYRRYCQGARERYEKLFTLDRMIDNCLEIYGTLNDER